MDQQTYVRCIDDILRQYNAQNLNLGFTPDFFWEFSYGLVNAKNTAPHLKLKLLELYRCHDLEYLQVFAPNLISFKYDGKQTTLSIKDAKQLASLRLSSPDYILLGAKNFVFSHFSSHFSNLKSLVVSAHLFEDISDLTQLCVFSNLKQLVVDVKFTWSTCLCYRVVASIIRGAPLLEQLEIVLPPCIPKWQEYPALELASMSPHQNLKEVKLFGFRGDENTMEFLSYLSENTVSLQKIDIIAHSALRHGEDLIVDNALY
ncbi:uncharacterized protein LOC110737137 [Chenopodium quinoa]|uniref:uncharacterized protein LOC110737137 n=1 Tax=Chenopodium quinoa TaxID=63459 RepID=UPI000B7848E1|nr:uncharacterized protein LOC110737137 [Chenopodium quinoa]